MRHSTCRQPRPQTTRASHLRCAIPTAPKSRPATSSTTITAPKANSPLVMPTVDQNPCLHPQVSEVRQCLGQVHSMQSLSPKVEMERKARRMEVGWILLHTIAAATCALDFKWMVPWRSSQSVIQQQRRHQHRPMPACKLRDQCRFRDKDQFHQEPRQDPGLPR